MTQTSSTRSLRTISAGRPISSSLSDMAEAFRKPRLWVFLGLRDFTMTYDRAQFGLVWSLIQPTVWIIAVYFFLGPAFSDSDRNYALYLSVGVALYFYLSTVVGGGSGLFLRFKGIVTNVRAPLFALPLRHAFSTSSQLMLHLSIPAVVFTWTNETLSWTMLLALPALAMIMLAAAFVAAGMGVIGARFGDFQFIITAAMRVLIFVTPIFWYPEDREGTVRAVAVTYNPFAHLIDIVRSPLMGKPPSTETLIGASLTLFLAVSFGTVLFALGRRNIIRWI
jgi:lipopolysaccharide transport system permease protein